MRWIMRMNGMVVAVVALAGVACGDGTGGDRDGSVPGMDAGRADGGRRRDGSIAPDTGPPGCASDAECDDGIDCTADTCTTGTGACRHQVVPALCPAGSSCHPVRGCEMGRPCGTDDECMDEDACTVNERCDPAARTCVVDPLDGDRDGDPPRVCGGSDCDDSSRTVYGGAPELCDGADNDCDGAVDEGLETPVCTYCTAQYECSRWAAETCYDNLVNYILPGLDCLNRDAVTEALRSCADANCDEQSDCTNEAIATCECRPPMTFCSDFVGPGCFSLQTDEDHCGDCATRCPFGMECSSGTCRCPAGQTLCGGVCINTATDSMHCGACDNICPSDATCVSGTCRCSAGRTLCGAECRDLTSDSANCGACGRSCSWPLTCVGGSCECRSGTTFCTGRSGGCVDLDRDEYNCGACENPCAGECVGGVCNTCSGAGEPCCVSSGWHYCRDGFTCSSGTGLGGCVACGAAGEPCCDLGGGVVLDCDVGLDCDWSAGEPTCR